MNFFSRNISIVKQTILLCLLTIFFLNQSYSQELFVGANSEFYLGNGMDFTTTNTSVTINSLGIFSVEAGNNWGTSQEYVDGKVTVYGIGITKLPIGNDGIYAPVIADHSGDMDATYYHASPFTGSLGTNVDDKSDIEFWELTGNATITLPWDTHSDMTTLVNNNGGSINSISIIGLNGSTWNLISAPQTNTVSGNLSQGNVTSDSSTKVNLNSFSQFTFGIDHQAVLDVDDILLNKDIVLLNNPVKTNSEIVFKTSNIVDGLNVIVYDINGKILKNQGAININNGIGKISSTNLASGVYMLKFEHEGKLAIKKLIIE